jgi:formylglycine-generating enzyme required for sulfatase activity
VKRFGRYGSYALTASALQRRVAAAAFWVTGGRLASRFAMGSTLRLQMCIGCALATLLGCAHPKPVETPAQIAPISISRFSVRDVEFLLIPAGSRCIGTNNSRSNPCERPQTLFALDYPLYLSRTKVTWGQFRSVMGWPAQLVGDPDEPAIATWTEANEFCQKLSKDLERSPIGGGWTARLPREAEWEYAACFGRDPMEDYWPRAAMGTPDDLTTHEWYDANSHGSIHPVAKLLPNSAGLYDMLGDVEEWCDGWLTDSVTSMLKGEASDPKMRPVRGGSWAVPEQYCRPSIRTGGPERGQSGFRVAVVRSAANRTAPR